MINFDYITKDDIKGHNPNWQKSPDHPFRLLIIGGSVSGKANTLLNMIIIIALLKKVIYMLKIHMKQNINVLSKILKMVILKI